MRRIRSRYEDPLDAIWTACAARLGLRLRRAPGAYATTDGRGTLRIAPDEDLDADDCLAQMICHEICHWLVQGEDSIAVPDWGLRNDEADAGYHGDTIREQACLRTQAALLRRYGLRTLLAPTTDFRSFYDALPADPLATDPADPALPLCRAALGRAARSPFAGPLHDALQATAVVSLQVRAVAAPAGAATSAGDADASATAGAGAAASPLDSERNAARLPSLWMAEPAPPRHPTGPPLREATLAPATCASCAWRTGARISRCRRTAEDEDRVASRVDPAWPACVLYEAKLDCQACGACCRNAYDLVPLSRRDVAYRRHPDLILHGEGGRLMLRRDPRHNRCAALTSADGADGGPYACTIYDDRPATCRDFTASSANCLTARRRVGLSV